MKQSRFRVGTVIIFAGVIRKTPQWNWIEMNLRVLVTKYNWIPFVFEIVNTSSRHQWINIINTLRPRQNGRHFPDDILKCIFLNENAWISIKISLKFVLKGPISNIPALVQIMAWRRTGGKPLSEPMLVSLLTHICVTRPQWVKNQTNSNYITMTCNSFVRMRKDNGYCEFLLTRNKS